MFITKTILTRLSTETPFFGISSETSTLPVVIDLRNILHTNLNSNLLKNYEITHYNSNLSINISLTFDSQSDYDTFLSTNSQIINEYINLQTLYNQENSINKIVSFETI